VIGASLPSPCRRARAQAIRKPERQSMSEDLPNLKDLDLKAFIVDLDGVVTHTAEEHAIAWKQLFDDFLRKFAEREGKPFVEFDAESDYNQYVDGMPRYDGVKTFLDSRGVEIPYGSPEDPPERETVCGLGNRKNLLFQEVVRTQGVEVFDSTIDLLKAMREAGLKTAVVSSSKNCHMVLDSVDLLGLFDVMVDGKYAAEQGLPGKPAPDTYVRAAELLGVPPEDCAIVEDSVVGVQSGRAGNFKIVIGVDRGVGKQTLLDNGADVAVGDMGEMRFE
jgi:beta-phosphoglucomutase family hydrolase